MPGPFKILAHHTWIKAERRNPLATGEAITVKAVQASSSDPNAPVANLMSQGGLRDRDLDGLDEQSGDAAQMWLSAKGDSKGWVEFDFGAPQKLSTICLWNYNDTWHTDRGVRTANISVWTQEAGWKTIRTDLPIEQAEGGDGYDEPTVVTLDAVPAQKVRLDNFTSLGDTDCLGLSQVQFFTARGPAAVKPYPRDGIAGVGLSKLALTWIPGIGATAHNVYLGTDPQDLPLLGKVSGAEARLSRLADQTKYHWRVDTIQADGSIVKGATWSFTTSGLLAWWKLDESEGQDVEDSSPYGNAGTLVGNAKWQPGAGRNGGALELDGKSGYIRIRNETAFDITDEITVAAWVKVRAFNRTWQTVVAKGDHTWRLARDGDKDTLQFAAGQYSEGRLVLGSVDINDGQWHHVVGVGDADAVALYVDGVLDSIKRVPGEILTDDEPVCIGENSMFTGRVWDGWIDEVCVFTYALSADEIKALYSGKAPNAIGVSSSSGRPSLIRPGIEAANPSPLDGAVGAGTGDLELRWSAGTGAQAHNVYVGTVPNDLKLLGKVQQTSAKLSNLANNTRYSWRIDGIQADGSVIAGKTWTFTTGGLAGWWKLDETEGTNVADSSGSHHDGLTQGDPQWQPNEGRIGGALALDGKDDFIQITDKTAFNVTDEITVAAWIKVRAFDRGWQTIVAKGDYAWRLARDRQRDALQFAAGKFEENRTVRGNIAVNDGKWHHVVGVGTPERISLYVDGVLDQTVAVPGKMQIDDMPVSIGENSDPTCRGRYWNGWIDELYVFTYALSDEEVKALYSGQAPQTLVAQASATEPCLVQTTVTASGQPAAPAPIAAASPPPQPQIQPVSAAAPGQEDVAPQPATMRRNLTAVLVIVAAVGLIAGFSTLRRNRT
jgi:hypothetical protein